MHQMFNPARSSRIISSDVSLLHWLFRVSFGFRHWRINIQVLPIAVSGIVQTFLPPKLKCGRKMMHWNLKLNVPFLRLAIDNVWFDASVRIWIYFFFKSVKTTVMLLLFRGSEGSFSLLTPLSKRFLRCFYFRSRNSLSFEDFNFCRTTCQILTDEPILVNEIEDRCH